MRLLDTLRISILSLLRSKIRTFLTSFAVFIGVFVIIFLVSLSFGAQKILISQITNQFDLKSIFVVKQGVLNFDFFGANVQEDEQEEPKILNNRALEQIRRIEGVASADPVAQISPRKLEFKDKNFDSRVVNSASGAGWNLIEGDSIVTDLYVGKYTNLQDGEIVLTKDIADAYEKNYEDFIGQTIIITDQGIALGSEARPNKPNELKIVGIISNIRNYMYITNLDFALEQISEKNGYESINEYVETAGYQSLYVKAQEESQVRSISTEVKNLGFDATTLEDVLTLFNTFFNIIPLIFTIIGAISIFVAAIGIINTMIMSVLERTKEIGVMKAIGAKNTDILAIFICESGLIGFFGGIFAVGFSTLLMFIIEKFIINNILPSLDIEGITQIFITPIELIIITVISSTIIGVLAGLYPAFRASRLDPVKALRYE